MICANLSILGSNALHTPKQNKNSIKQRSSLKSKRIIDRAIIQDMAKISLDFNNKGIIMHIENSPQPSAKKSKRSFQSVESNYPFLYYRYS